MKEFILTTQNNAREKEKKAKEKEVDGSFVPTFLETENASDSSFPPQPSFKSQSMRDPLLGNENKSIEKKKKIEIEVYEKYVKKVKPTAFQKEVEAILEVEEKLIRDFIDDNPTGTFWYSKNLLYSRLGQIKKYKEALHSAIIFKNESFIEAAYDKIERESSPWRWNTFHIRIGGKVKRLRTGKLKTGTYGIKPISETLGFILNELENAKISHKEEKNYTHLETELGQLKTYVNRLKLKQQSAPQVPQATKKKKEKIVRESKERLPEKLETGLKKETEGMKSNPQPIAVDPIEETVSYRT